MLSPVQHNRQYGRIFVCSETVRGALPANRFFTYTASTADVL